MSQTTEVRVAAPPAAPYARLLRIGAGVCLILAALTNGLSQYVGGLMTPDLSFTEQIAWGVDHPVAHRTEQTLLVVSSLVMPLGLLGIAQVTRWHRPRLTLVATPLVLWGMWGFHNVLSMGYVSGTVAPRVQSVADASRLNDSFVADPGVVGLALVPHLVGSFLGVLLLSVAAWRSGVFPAVACAAIVAFLVWDFLLPSRGLLEPHLLLLVGWTWLGVALLRMPQRTWAGQG